MPLSFSMQRVASSVERMVMKPKPRERSVYPVSTDTAKEGQNSHAGRRRSRPSRRHRNGRTRPRGHARECGSRAQRRRGQGWRRRWGRWGDERESAQGHPFPCEVSKGGGGASGVEGEGSAAANPTTTWGKASNGRHRCAACVANQLDTTRDGYCRVDSGRIAAKASSTLWVKPWVAKATTSSYALR